MIYEGCKFTDIKVVLMMLSKLKFKHNFPNFPNYSIYKPWHKCTFSEGSVDII